ncbi:MAG: hypothetical protein KDA93_01750 [Planctomycetaceae bacterium]|nr:hypothetical protein [Planctomycetaceae bacterium]
MTEWRPFQYAWETAHDSPDSSDDITGAWVGPWRNESTGKEGAAKLVIRKSEHSGYEGIVKLFVNHPVLPKLKQTNNGQPWEFDLLIHAERQADGEFSLGGRGEQVWMFGRNDITCEGTVRERELVATFRRGSETGRMRLKRINPYPKHEFMQIPGLITVEYSPIELREEVAEAFEMPLDATGAESDLESDDVLPVSYEE